MSNITRHQFMKACLEETAYKKNDAIRLFRAHTKTAAATANKIYSEVLSSIGLHDNFGAKVETHHQQLSKLSEFLLNEITNNKICSLIPDFINVSKEIRACLEIGKDTGAAVGAGQFTQNNFVFDSKDLGRVAQRVISSQVGGAVLRKKSGEMLAKGSDDVIEAQFSEVVDE